jgi:hypothetical protein
MTGKLNVIKRNVEKVWGARYLPKNTVIHLSLKRKIHVGTKRPDRQWNLSSLSSVCAGESHSNAEVKNGRSYTSTLICFHSVIRDNFIF